jgi:hypothetical protein
MIATWVSGLGLGFILGAVVCWLYVCKKMRESARAKCVAALRKEADSLYQIEHKASADLIKNEARKVAHVYSAAAMLIQEMEL